MQKHAFIDYYRPVLRREAIVFDILVILGASVFIALSAQIAFNVPFSPVPITGQTFAVLLTGALLGSRRGTLAILAYLLEGIAGLPVFAQAHFGLIHIVGPTGGYLIGFIPAAFVCGYLAEKGWIRSLAGAFTSMVIGTVIIFISGLIWLSLVMGTENLLIIGFFPYISGAFLKIVFAALILSGSSKVLKRKIDVSG